jgi:hypothetical protein
MQKEKQAGNFCVVHAPASSMIQTVQQSVSLAGQSMVEFNDGQVSDVQVLVV